MVFDPTRDRQRLLLALTGASMLLIGVLAAAAVQAFRAPWSSYQEQRGLPAAARGLKELTTACGTVDRCTTCHVDGSESSADASPATSELGRLLSRQHSFSLAAHPPRTIGCTACHGGTGRATSRDAAHAIPGLATMDPLLRPPHLAAACTRCHVPGSVAGTERVVAGANLYLRLGCGMCHSLSPEGRGGWDFGPDLRTIGRRTPDALTTSLRDPKADFPDSTMPSFAATFDGDDEGLRSLLVFLESLTLPPGCPDARQKHALVSAPCATCHAGLQGRALGRFAHRCSYLNERREELTCARCHATVPATSAGNECALMREHQSACPACHGGQRP